MGRLKVRIEAWLDQNSDGDDSRLGRALRMISPRKFGTVFRSLTTAAFVLDATGVLIESEMVPQDFPHATGGVR
jgi:hypothetical protein